MAIVKYGKITATGSAYNLDLGFVPNHFRLVNDTKLAAGTGVAISEYFSQFANGSAYLQTLTAGAPVITKVTTNGFTPYQTGNAALWVPTNLTITGISQAANASITATHAFTAADVGLTVVTFSGVVGMIQINTLRGVIQSVTGTSSFTVNIDSTAFSSYVSGGIANIITGIPAVTNYPVTGPLATPQQNAGHIGLTLGSSVCGSANDVLYWEAVLDTPVTS
jgi:hypothetical protein